MSLFLTLLPERIRISSAASHSEGSLRVSVGDGEEHVADESGALLWLPESPAGRASWWPDSSHHSLLADD